MGTREISRCREERDKVDENPRLIKSLGSFKGATKCVEDEELTF